MTHCVSCPDFCELCHACQRERAAAMERRALDAERQVAEYEQRLKDAAKVCRQRTAERDDARERLENLRYNRPWSREDVEALQRERDEVQCALFAAQRDKGEYFWQREDARRKLDLAEKERNSARGAAKDMWCDLRYDNQRSDYLRQYPWLRWLDESRPAEDEGQPRPASQQG